MTKLCFPNKKPHIITHNDFILQFGRKLMHISKNIQLHS